MLMSDCSSDVCSSDLRHRAGHHRARVLQIGGRIGLAADFAVVAVLIGGTAMRALALDVAIGQEHAALGIEQLLDRTPCADRTSTRLNSSHYCASRMPSSAGKTKTRKHPTDTPAALPP